MTPSTGDVSDRILRMLHSDRVRMDSREEMNNVLQNGVRGEYALSISVSNAIAARKSEMVETIAEVNCTYELRLAPVRTGLEVALQNRTETKKEVTRFRAAGDATLTSASPIRWGEKKPITNQEGDATQWMDWRFKVATWFALVESLLESFLRNIDKMEKKMDEPAEECSWVMDRIESTPGEEWCSQEIYQILARKAEGVVLTMVRTLSTQRKTRGIRAWVRVMREAEGQAEANKLELAGKLHDTNRKAVNATELPVAISQWEGELREY